MSDFTRVTGREPHFERTRRLLKAHPEARSLVGNAPITALAVFGVVAAQLVAAWLLRDAPWWGILLGAYLVGAFADHALWTLIHECTHNLVFEKSPENSWLQIVANLPIVIPAAIAFRRYHILHHNHQGDVELDADLPSALEARLVGNKTVRKTIWLAFYFVVQVLLAAAVIYGWGWASLVYLLLSSVFAIGLHPVGARWIQEHYLTHPGGQETFSYYGPLNVVAFNVGYHNEHHDLMRVPWMRLPMIRRMAPELYDPLHHHTSWTRLLFQFLFDPRLGLHSRVVRSPAPPGDEQRVATELQEILAKT